MFLELNYVLKLILLGFSEYEELLTKNVCDYDIIYILWKLNENDQQFFKYTYLQLICDVNTFNSLIKNLLRPWLRHTVLQGLQF